MTKIRNSGTIINTDYRYSQLISRQIENAIIPSNINIIGGYAFRGSRVKELYIPENIKTISVGAFENCSYLEKLEFADNSVNTLNQNSFSSCSSLREIKLPEGLATIIAGSFMECSLLEKVTMPKTITRLQNAIFRNDNNLSYIFFNGNTVIRNHASSGSFENCPNIRLFDMRYMLSAKDKASANDLTANNVYLYINVPDNLYDEFVALPNWSALNLKHFVHSCDVNSFEEIANPQEGHYYSLKNDKNYLNPLGEKQIDIRQYVDGSWIEVDIDA